jgi:hypothetical protein
MGDCGRSHFIYLVIRHENIKRKLEENYTNAIELNEFSLSVAAAVRK